MLCTCEVCLGDAACFGERFKAVCPPVSLICMIWFNRNTRLTCSNLTNTVLYMHFIHIHCKVKWPGQVVPGSRYKKKNSCSKVWIHIFNNSYKGIVHPKMLFQTCINVFHLLNAKESILKNVSQQTVSGPHWLL